MARVLVVDDEAKLAKFVAQALELDGHDVVRAGGGREALTLLAERPFEVVVTDLRMPEVDGLAVLNAARPPPPAAPPGPGGGARAKPAPAGGGAAGGADRRDRPPPRRERHGQEPARP